jgi:ribokinase
VAFLASAKKEAAGTQMNRPIVVVGSANLDLVCTASKLPSPGETVWGDSFDTFHGGKGANQAVAAGRLGSDVRMVAKVGDDDFGKALRHGLLAASVNVDDVSTAYGTRSGVALISVDAKGQNSIIVIPGANGELRPEDLDRCLPRLQSAGMILAQLEIPMDTVEYLGYIAHRAGVPLMLDPAPARAIPHHILRCVTYLTPNDTETAVLCGFDADELTLATAAEAAEMLLNAGTANVIIKMSSRGAFVAGADGLRKMVPALKVPVVDSTAAGDAFNGGLASALMRDMALEPAVRFASAVAAASVMHTGAQSAMPSAQAVAELLRQHDTSVDLQDTLAKPVSS